jgi:hypothetical protein
LAIVKQLDDKDDSLIQEADGGRILISIMEVDDSGNVVFCKDEVSALLS